MLKDILGTLATRYLIAILNLALIFINARVLGIEGVGLVGLIWASVSINVTVNSIFSGNTLVYFLNQYPVRILYPVAVCWTFAGSALGCGALHLSGLLPEGYAFDIYGLTVLYSLGVAHSRFLLGKDHIRGFNLTNVLQGGLLFFILLYFYYVAHRQEVSAYIWGLYLTNGIAFAVSLFFLLPYLRKPEKPAAERKRLFPILKEMLAYGLWGSADNIAETCTTRLNYFLLERFAGVGSVGLLDAGVKISESVWNISRSVAYIEYNRIAKTQDKGKQKQITLQLFKLTFFAISFVMAGILLIPERVYTDYLFSMEFKGIRNVIAALSVGIVALGCNTILSHYFIGSGKIRYSTAASCIGLVCLLIAGSFLIPAYGVTGAALSAGIAFSAMLLFSLVVFIRRTKSRSRDFLPCRDDFRLSP
ncbi:MAG: polysaccharide biosynthesis C-terminal domain-containing protein [Tannerellaceae bacterium]|jgi:O-antigen/teichoic acid export membrane protein|nr:polysaccharide biosynthesis C-terminal domain-containing protein [Tannerellaceae bacterium]